jgi:hypothetical protein
VWWQRGLLWDWFGSGEGQAVRVRDEVENHLWPLFERVLGRTPIPDGDRRYVANGGDHRYDIVLIRELSDPFGDTREVWRGLNAAPAARFSLVKRDLRDNQLLPKVAHQLMRGFLSAFDCRQQCTWLERATATWAEHLAYRIRNSEHEYAKDLFQNPSRSLNTDSPAQGDRHPYAAYVFLLFLQHWRGGDAGADLVRRIWEATETGADTVAAIDGVIPGGFAAVWREFMLANWNDGPSLVYRKLDGLEDGVSRWRVARATTTPARAGPASEYVLDTSQTSSITIPIDVQLPPLSAAYFIFHLDLSVRTIQLTHNLQRLGASGAELVVLLRQGDNWSVQPRWSNENVRSICRDATGQGFHEIVVMLGNRGRSGTQTFVAGGVAPSLTASTESCLTGVDDGFEECRFEVPRRQGNRAEYVHSHTETWRISRRSAQQPNPTNEVRYDYTWTAEGDGRGTASNSGAWWWFSLRGSGEMGVSRQPSQQVAARTGIPARDTFDFHELSSTGVDIRSQALSELSRPNRTAPLLAPRIEGFSPPSTFATSLPGTNQIGTSGMVSCRWSWPAFRPGS